MGMEVVLCMRCMSLRLNLLCVLFVLIEFMRSFFVLCLVVLWV